MRVEIWTDKSSQPRVFEASATYQKGDMICVASGDGKRYKFPIVNIYMVVESDFIPSIKEAI